MGRTSKELFLSACALFLVLALAAGSTFAWLSDMATTDAAFEAGIFDLVLTSDGTQAEQGLQFAGLRSLTRKQLEGRWADQGEPEEGYFQTVRLSNAGSLSSYVTLTIQEETSFDDSVPNLQDNGVGGMTLSDPARVDCQNGLREDIQILLYTRGSDGALRPVEQNGQVVALWKDGAALSYTLPQPLAMGETREFILAAGLSETAETPLFGQHFHASVVASAIQTESGVMETVTARDLPVSYIHKSADGTVLYRATAKRTLTDILPGEVWIQPAEEDFDSARYELKNPDDACVIQVDEKGNVTIPDSEEILFELKETYEDDLSRDFDSGSGTPEDPYVAMNARQLDNLRKFPGATAVLGRDIDLAGYYDPDWASCGWTEENGWLPIGTVPEGYQPFTGTLDGQGHIVTGLRIENTTGDYIGLFSVLPGQVKNLTVQDADIRASGRAIGIFAGDIYDGTFENCHVQGKVTGVGAEQTGGFAGFILNDAPVLRDCSAKVDLETDGGESHLFSVMIHKPTIENCWAEGTINGESGSYNRSIE